MNNAGYTVYVIDDDEAMRNSLHWLIESAGYHVITYTDAVPFLNAQPHASTACVVADMRMPGMTGLELYQSMNEKQSHLPVIIITGHGDVPMAVNALKAGVYDFIEKPFDDQQLLDSIAQAIQYCIRKQEQAAIREEIESRIESLTSREREVMDKIVMGLSNKQIASVLGISIKTVEVHRANVMEKMHASSLAALVRMSLGI